MHFAISDIQLGDIPAVSAITRENSRISMPVTLSKRE